MWIHDYQVMQGLTDSYETIIGHNSEEETLRGPQPHINIELSDTAHIADGLVRSPQVNQHLRNDASCEAQIQER